MRIDPTFDAKKPETWPVTLTVGQVAAIYQRTPGALRRACHSHLFQPSPYRTRPFLWRRVDVLRDVEGARGAWAKAS